MSDSSLELNVKALQARVRSIRDELREAEAALAAARVALCPFQVGDKVEAMHKGLWEPAVIHSIDAQSWGTWYMVSFYKKDGKLGVPRHAYSAVRKAQTEVSGAIG